MKRFTVIGFGVFLVAQFTITERLASQNPTATETVGTNLEEIKVLRNNAARRKRRLVLHSDGYPMMAEHRGIFEPTAPPSLFPQLAGTQTGACTYSLVHQFPVARLYRSKIAQEWPPGIIEKMYGDGPDGLDTYIELCRNNHLEAFWGMRTNDTHDASGAAHGLMRWNSNRWKQAHLEFLVGDRGTPMPFGRWSALDYARPEVREKVFRVLEEVCRNYEIDGLMLDFFRHLPTFKTTVGGAEATTQEVEMLTDLFRRIRRMADEVGAQRRRPILIAVRAPDSLGYARALGLDIEKWMKDDLIDIWIATGYFRLQDWSKTVASAHRYGVQLWAAIDDSRIVQRQDRNALEIYRGRIQNAWNAGVDAVWLFNFFYGRDDAQFELLNEAGDPATLDGKDKVYVAEARGFSAVNHYLKDGDRFVTRPRVFSPAEPATLKPDQSVMVRLQVGDDIATIEQTAEKTARATLRIQANPGNGADELAVRFNDHALSNQHYTGDWIEYDVRSAIVNKGPNQIAIHRGAAARSDPVLRDLQLAIRYTPQVTADSAAPTRNTQRRRP